MKVTINIDCTPQEARAMLGLPDLEPIQNAVHAGLKERLEDIIRTMDAETLMKMWAPGGIKGLEELQKAFWAGLTGESGGDSTEK